MRIGAAIHSVRAVPAGNSPPWPLGRGARRRRCMCTSPSRPRRTTPAWTPHGCTPTRLLADHGVLGPRTTGVHNTHLTDEDIAPHRLHPAPARACAPPPNGTSPTASAPPSASSSAGSPLSLGSDSHAVIDLLEEARAMELNERLRTRTRGHWTARSPAARRHGRRARRPRLARGGRHRARRARRPHDDRAGLRQNSGAAAAARRRDRGIRRDRGGRTPHGGRRPPYRARRSARPGPGCPAGPGPGHRRPARLSPAGPSRNPAGPCPSRPNRASPAPYRRSTPR